MMVIQSTADGVLVSQPKEASQRLLFILSIFSDPPLAPIFISVLKGIYSHTMAEAKSDSKPVEEEELGEVVLEGKKKKKPIAKKAPAADAAAGDAGGSTDKKPAEEKEYQYKEVRIFASFFSSFYFIFVA